MRDILRETLELKCKERTQWPFQIFKVTQLQEEKFSL